MAELNMSLTGGGHSGVEAINYWVARHRRVRSAIDRYTDAVYEGARGIHALNRDTGDSYIEKDFGDVDGYVILSDEQGLDQAFAIEFGHFNKKADRWVDGMHAITWWKNGGL